MKARRLFTRQSPAEEETWLKRLEPELPTAADLILLCSFREDLDGERTYNQLRDSLVAEGFRAPLARYVIRSSAILHRVSRSRYRLCSSPASAGIQPDSAPLSSIADRPDPIPDIGDTIDPRNAGQPPGASRRAARPVRVERRGRWLVMRWFSSRAGAARRSRTGR